MIFIPLILILNNNDSNFSTLVVQQQKNLQNKNLNLSNNFYDEVKKNINNILKFGIKKINLVEFILNIIKNNNLK